MLVSVDACLDFLLLCVLFLFRNSVLNLFLSNALVLLDFLLFFYVCLISCKSTLWFGWGQIELRRSCPFGGTAAASSAVEVVSFLSEIVGDRMVPATFSLVV